MCIAKKEIAKIEEFIVDIFQAVCVYRKKNDEKQDYSRSFRIKNAVKAIRLVRIIPVSFQIGRTRSISYFD